MQGQANFAAYSINSIAQHPSTMPGTAEKNRVERLPFTIRFARDEADLRKAVSIRHSAYARHVPTLAERLKDVEPMDMEDGVSVLLAESKLDGRPVGTMRIQTNVYRPLALEGSVTLPDRFKGMVLAEATRLGVTQERMGRMVTTLLFKAFLMHCLNDGVDFMVIAARSPMDRRYEALMMEDIFPEQGYIPMKHASDIPHRVMSLEMTTLKECWEEMQHPLYELFFHTSHPDIDVNHMHSLPQFLCDFKCKATGFHGSTGLRFPHDGIRSPAVSA